jgi:phage baseplate assembly protein W
MSASFQAGLPYEPRANVRTVEPAAVIPARYVLLAIASETEAPGKIGVLVTVAATLLVPGATKVSIR